MTEEIKTLEKQIWDLHSKLEILRRDTPPVEVKNYRFKNLEGEVTLLDLFAGKETLFMIHNMGQGCRYCTLWADGMNPWVTHLEERFAVVLVSKDSPETQRKFANSRGWRFRMTSHEGGEYLKEQTVSPNPNPESYNFPGMVCYKRLGDKIFKKNQTIFGPGDDFCSLWHVLSLAGFGEETWTPQYNYWRAPAKLEDGGENLLT